MSTLEIVPATGDAAEVQAEEMAGPASETMVLPETEAPALVDAVSVVVPPPELI